MLVKLRREARGADVRAFVKLQDAADVLPGGGNDRPTTSLPGDPECAP
jgi:hypothetical protein